MRIYLFALILLLLSLKAEAEISMNKSDKPVKYVGSLIGLKPEYRERYIILHKYTFPGVLDRIRKSNITNYSIFLLDDILFSHYEYIGTDFQKDMAAIADPVTKDWWKLTDPMQQPLDTRKEVEWWAEMELILSINKILKPSPGAVRIGLSAEIVEGSIENIKKLCSTFTQELEEETYKHGFQNCHLYYKDKHLYYYYEYIGNDIQHSFSELNKSPLFSDFQANLTKFLVLNQQGYWEQMKEVFHTD